MSILSVRPGKGKGAARKPLHRGRLSHRNSKGTVFRLFLYIGVFSCVMNTRHGAGDRTRTGTLSPAVDFESTTSTNSITPAGARDIIHDSRRFCKCRKNFLDRELVGARYMLDSRKEKDRETQPHRSRASQHTPAGSRGMPLPDPAVPAGLSGPLSPR